MKYKILKFIISLGFKKPKDDLIKNKIENITNMMLYENNKKLDIVQTIKIFEGVTSNINKIIQLKYNTILKDKEIIENFNNLKNNKDV